MRRQPRAGAGGASTGCRAAVGAAARVTLITLATLATLIACAAPAHATEACGTAGSAPAHQVARQGEWTVAWVAEPPVLRADQVLNLDLRVCGPQAVRSLRVDATMPAHRHGMNYRPRVEQIAPGRFRAEGLVLHMPGAWRFEFVLETAAGRQRLLHDIDVP